MADGINGEVRSVIKESLKTMTPMQKVLYLLDCYKWHLLITIVLLSVAIHTIVAIATKKEMVLSVAVINGPAANEDKINELAYNYCKSVGIDTDTCEILIDINYTIGHGENETVMGDYQTQKLMASASMGMLDVIITDKETFEFLSENGFLMNMEDLLDKDEHDRLAERIVKADVVDDEDNRTQEETGIDITGFEKVASEGWYYDTGCYVGVNYYTENKDRCLEFIDYITEK
ncbi:MAG: hypothetical protein K5662_04830 [Lachnospiraceae bacterium]|nr:hypothetical protein [Lachnospiraceae bacterium]